MCIWMHTNILKVHACRETVAQALGEAMAALDTDSVLAVLKALRSLQQVFLPILYVASSLFICIICIPKPHICHTLDTDSVLTVLKALRSLQQVCVPLLYVLYVYLNYIRAIHWMHGLS